MPSGRRISLSFRDIALPVIAKGIPVTPLQPNSKKAFLPGWQTSASRDPAQIEEWSMMYPSAKCGAVATGEPDGIWLFNADTPNVLDRIATETNHDLLTEVPSCFVRSRAGRGHCYFR